MEFDEKTMGNQLNELMIEALEEVLENKKLPEVNETLFRMLKEGYNEQDIMELLKFIVGFEISRVLDRQEPLNRKRLQQALNKVPQVLKNYKDKSALKEEMNKILEIYGVEKRLG